MIYLDNAANTYVNCFAASAAIAEMRNVGNPSSLHSAGIDAKRRLDNAEEDILSYIGCKTGRVYFTSGGTEANNIAIRMLAEYGESINKNHFITTAFEHSSVMRVFKSLEEEGFEVTYLKPDSDGIICPNDVEASIKENTIAVSMMYVNNEIGTIQPVNEVGRICKKHKIPFHCDAVQAVGHIPVDMDKNNISLLSASAHKFGGITGTGFLAQSCNFKKFKFKPIMFGGSQNMGVRPGTENMVGIMAMRAALEIVTDKEKMNTKIEETTRLRNYFTKLLNEIPDIRYNGSFEEGKRIHNNVNISFKDINSENLVYLLSKEGVCVSTTSACESKAKGRNYVLKSIGLDDEYINGTIRITLSDYTTEADVRNAFGIIKQCVNTLRAFK